jgi:outer membrane protein assembly factor BamB
MPDNRSLPTIWVSLMLSSLVWADQDWPQWRGPHRDGKSSETGIIDEFTSAGPPLLWEAKELGSGYSSVSVADGRIFTLGRRGDAEQLIAVDEQDGREIWAADVGDGGHSNGTPTVDGQRVYVIGLNGNLICADTSSGDVIWRRDFKSDFGGKMMSGWGYSESPLVDGNRLVCTPGAQDAMIVALDKHTGKEIWRAPVPDFGSRGQDGAGYSSIVISEGAGVKQYIQMTGRGVIGLRSRDGKFLWGYNDVANDTANIPTPIISGEHVFCSTGYGAGAALLKMTKVGNEIEVEEVYFLDAKTFQNHHGGMILVGNHVYAGAQHNQGFPVCIALKTGHIAWGGEQRGPGTGSAAITFADGKLVFRYQDGVVALIDATNEEYRLRGSFKPAYQKDNSWAHPVIAKGRLYLREQDRLLCYDIRKPSE